MTDPEQRSAEDEARRRRLAALFDDALPERTRDERPEGWGERESPSSADERLRREVPPHHG